MWELLLIAYISLLDTPNLFTLEVDYDQCHESCNGCWMAENSHACVKCADGYYRKNGYCISKCVTRPQPIRNTRLWERLREVPTRKLCCGWHLRM